MGVVEWGPPCGTTSSPNGLSDSGSSRMASMGTPEVLSGGTAERMRQESPFEAGGAVGASGTALEDEAEAEVVATGGAASDAVSARGAQETT